jgi:FKBP12-rapamycin complex-associated protein
VCAGYVIEPYHRYPDLLDLILNEVKTQQLPSMRMEVVKVLGILGALDPYTHKLQQIGIQRVRLGQGLIFIYFNY